MNHQPAPMTDSRVTVTPLPWRYSRTAVVLHWAVAFALAVMAGLGWFMMSIEDEPGSGLYFELHKSFGIVLAVLIVARVAWRITHRPEPLPASVPIWQARLAQAVQVMLYALTALMVLTGYLGAAYSKAGVKLFGLATPRWALPDHARAEQWFGIHSVLIWVLVAAVAIHVLGALKHLLVDRDGTFRRMWSGRR